MEDPDVNTDKFKGFPCKMLHRAISIGRRPVGCSISPEREGSRGFEASERAGIRDGGAAREVGPHRRRRRRRGRRRRSYSTSALPPPPSQASPASSPASSPSAAASERGVPTRVRRRSSRRGLCRRPRPMPPRSKCGITDFCPLVL